MSKTVRFSEVASGQTFLYMKPEGSFKGFYRKKPLHTDQEGVSSNATCISCTDEMGTFMRTSGDEFFEDDVEVIINENKKEGKR